MPRPDLTGLLDDGRDGRLTVVSAPTGSGKTTALAEWAAQTPARVAWYTLDKGDNDPLRFWTYVVAAIGDAAPELPGTAARRLRAPGVSLADEVLPVLVNEVAGVREPLAIVLDDYHEVAEPAIHQDLGYLLERLPPQVHLIVSSQTDPPLRIGRLRAQAEVAELGAPQLRFSDAEAAELLNGRHALALTADELSGVQARTEGWVAGLHLVGLTLRDRADRADVLARMPIDDRFLVDYLWDEVAARQEPEVQDFLVMTAVLEQLSGPLCDAVTGRRGSAEILEALERGNVFVVPLDPTRTWFRYHHLFRSMLRRRLERLAPESVADLHRRASSWYAERADVRGAVDHALEAGDMHVAADALRRSWLELYSDGEANALMDWIDRLPRDILADYPELALARGGVARAMGRVEEAEPWLRFAEEVATASTDEEQRRELLATVAHQRSMGSLARADVRAAVAHGREAVALRPAGSPLAGADRFFLAIALFWTEERAEAEALFHDYLAQTAAGEQDVRRVFAMALLAQAHAVRGALEDAERFIAASLGTSQKRGLGEHPPTEATYVALGIVELARGDAERAEADFEHAATLARSGGDHIEVAQSLLWLGRCRAALGDRAGAEEAGRAAAALLDGAHVPVLAELAAALASELPATAHAPSDSEADEDQQLSPAELRILELLPSDLTYREIASRLHLSLNTVRTHSRRIRRKLGASTRDQAVAAARRHDLL
ncbi:MAG: LuxR C-terminal-related transcriptional regulator [Solirubrobacteraceae bacterium]